MLSSLVPIFATLRLFTMVSGEPGYWVCGSGTTAINGYYKYAGVFSNGQEVKWDKDSGEGYSLRHTKWNGNSWEWDIMKDGAGTIYYKVSSSSTTPPAYGWISDNEVWAPDPPPAGVSTTKPATGCGGSPNPSPSPWVPPWNPSPSPTPSPTPDPWGPPAPAPGPEATCSQWPVFDSESDLQSSPWGAYFKSVYAELPSTYPVDVGKLWMLYNNALILNRIPNLPKSNTCPKGVCDRYTTNDYYQPPLVSWIWHPPAYTPVPPNTWTEVIHEADPFGDEQIGMWFQYAGGSGIWFYTGSTKVFNEHEDAYQYYAEQMANFPQNEYNQAMSNAAAQSGLDSVQFMQHVDHTNYQCDTYNTGHPGFKYLNFEIVGVRLAGTHACGTANGSPETIRGGWQGSQPCNCDDSKQFLNCKQTPQMTREAGDVEGNATSVATVIV